MLGATVPVTVFFSPGSSSQGWLPLRQIFDLVNEKCAGKPARERPPNTSTQLPPAGPGGIRAQERPTAELAARRELGAGSGADALRQTLPRD